MLEIDKLSVGFVRYAGWFRRTFSESLRDVSLSARPGEVVALVGASGAGKSLLAHGVLGILPPTARVTGAMRWQGEPLTAARQRQLRGRSVALVPQALTYLDPSARARRQVAWAAQAAGKSSGASLAVEELARCGLGAVAQRHYPHELSGGMARRVLTAMATVAQAQLLIADEPTTGLDAQASRQSLQYLRGLADQGRTVLVISHDLAALTAIANRFVVLDAGRCVESVEADDFMAGRVREAYTRNLRRALPQLGFQLPATADPRERHAALREEPIHA
ncbi:MAG: ABC transporter ATP-binding protein [Burkholderiaceae bacterium]|nr:ABC transporter ATP-binding protein [Burkholderiaceae bacterium]